MAKRLSNVELRGDAASRKILPTIGAASEDDWYEEYLDLIMAVKVVSDLGEAIEHINHYSSAHSDTIVTRDEAAARRFILEVDSASVLWNAIDTNGRRRPVRPRRRDRHQHRQASRARPGRRRWPDIVQVGGDRERSASIVGREPAPRPSPRGEGAVCSPARSGRGALSCG